MSKADDASAPEMDVEVLQIENLRPYHRNPREHTESVEHVMDSIRKFGFRVPVVVDADDTIVAGHGRFKAVQNLTGTLDTRISELRADGRDALAENLEVIHEGGIFAMFDSELDTHDISEFRITDNRISELSTWNDDLLNQELERLEGAVGFTEEELDDRLDDYDADLDLEDDGDEEDDGPYELPDSGTVGVSLTCPHCLEPFELSADQVRMELEMMTDDEDEAAAETDGEGGREPAASSAPGGDSDE